MTSLEIIKFKRDTELRRQYFTPESFAHPAKLDAQLLLWIVDKYTQPGETILDLMAGSGTLMLACTMGRNVVMVELEDKFVNMQQANWQKVRQMPQLGYMMGDCKMMQGDARNLEGLFDTIVTSPPYAETKAVSDYTFMKKQADDYPSRLQEGKIKGHNRSPQAEKEYLQRAARGEIESENNIGNLPYGNIDAVITSPPYEEAMGEKHHSPRADKLAVEKSNPVTYTDRVDSIITSPPYANRLANEDREYHGGILQREYEKGNISFVEQYSYGKNTENIGNLKSESYLQAMSEVYKQCFKVLKDNGMMILITKNFIRNKQEVRLDDDTIELCEDAGFTFKERWYRELPAQSFWRIIYKQKYPDAPDLKYEDVLVFEKGSHK